MRIDRMGRRGSAIAIAVAVAAAVAAAVARAGHQGSGCECGVEAGRKCRRNTCRRGGGIVGATITIATGDATRAGRGRRRIATRAVTGHKSALDTSIGRKGFGGTGSDGGGARWGAARTVIDRIRIG